MKKKHLILTNGTVVTDSLIEQGTVVTIGDRIMYVGDQREGQRILKAADPNVFEIVDAQGGYIAPGLVDVHMHGSDGVELMDGTVEAMATMGRYLARHGTVAFLPSTVTAMKDKTRAVATLVADYSGAEDEAEVLGIHLEGPYINERYKGAQYGPAIRRADLDELAELHSILGDKLRLVTLAPEVPGSLQAIAWLKRGASPYPSATAMPHTNKQWKVLQQVSPMPHIRIMGCVVYTTGSRGSWSHFGHSGYLGRTDCRFGSCSSRCDPGHAAECGGGSDRLDYRRGAGYRAA